MRGKVWDILQPLADWGITPACAGKSCLAAIYAYNEGDHPRVCGEKSVPLRCSISAVGSPPRVRGKAWRLPAAPGTQGITPACAGKSGPISASGRAIRDHPRVCGEKALHDGGILPAQGSPPRMRGKALVVVPVVAPVGITPAYAGKRLWSSLLFTPLWDHPRVCGEKPEFLKSLSQGAGSPPRMRGKESKHISSSSAIRITPAYAGKRGSIGTSPGWHGDHPRVCGEKFWGKNTGCALGGSPPRMRGKGLPGKDGVAVLRITPAYAGKRQGH